MTEPRNGLQCQLEIQFKILNRRCTMTLGTEDSVKVSLQFIHWFLGGVADARSWRTDNRTNGWTQGKPWKRKNYWIRHQSFSGGLAYLSSMIEIIFFSDKHRRSSSTGRMWLNIEFELRVRVRIRVRFRVTVRVRNQVTVRVMVRVVIRVRLKDFDF